MTFPLRYILKEFLPSGEYSSLKESKMEVSLLEYHHEIAQEMLGINPLSNYAFRVYQDGLEILEGHVELEEEQIEGITQKLEKELVEDGFKDVQVRIFQTSH